MRNANRRTGLDRTPLGWILRNANRAAIVAKP